MWVRSQDREMLINCECFEILDEDAIWIIYGCNTTLATYLTKENAMKVLDEIHNLIDLDAVNGVYQMPQDGEV